MNITGCVSALEYFGLRMRVIFLSPGLSEQILNETSEGPALTKKTSKQSQQKTAIVFYDNFSRFHCNHHSIAMPPRDTDDRDVSVGPPGKTEQASISYTKGRIR